MKSNAKKTAVIFLATLLIFVAVIGVSKTWHSIPLEDKTIELSLESYNTKVTSSDACFVLGLKTYKELEITVKANGILSKSLSSEGLKKTNGFLCVRNDLLKQGQNFIEAGFEDQRVFFHVEKTESIGEEKPSIKLISFEKKSDHSSLGVLKFYVKNPPEKAEKIKILNNGIVVKDSFFPDGENIAVFEISEGKNNAEVFFDNLSFKASLENNPEFKSNFFAGIMLACALLTVLMVFVFCRKSIVENIAFSICALLALLSLIPFALATVGFLSTQTMIVSMIAVIAVIAFAFRKNFKIPEFKAQKPDYYSIFLTIFTLFVIFFNTITPTNVSLWTSFYEHQSKVIFEEQKIPLFDEHLNFGEKPFGYISGYFFANGGLGILFGNLDESVFAIMVFLSCVSLILCSYVFFKKTGMSKEKAKLSIMLMLLGSFLLSDMFFTPRHIMALSLSFFSLSLFTEKKWVKAGVLAGVAMLLQAPIIITILFIALALTGEKIREIAKYVALSFLVGLLLFTPNLSVHGIPSQASPETWGYLFGMPYYGILVDLLAQIVFFFIILLPALKFKVSLDSFAKRTLAILLILLAIQALITYRVNVATIIVFSFFGVYLFPEKLLNSAKVKKLFFAIFTIALLFCGYLVFAFYAPASAIQAAGFLREKTPDSERFLAEPALGHFTAFFTEKKIMSDLAVEYENPEYLEKSFEFLLDKNYSILSNYNIGYVFSRAHVIETQPVGSKWSKNPIEFEELDKIYDNGFFYVHKAINTS